MKTTYKLSILGLTKFSLFLVAISFASCAGIKKEEKQTVNKEDTCANPVSKELFLSKEQFESAAIEANHIEQKEVNDILKVNGKLDVPPQNLVSISAPLSGFLKSTEMLEGMQVKKGDVLAVLEHPEIVQLQQDFIEAKSKYELLELEFKRQQELNTENVNSQKIVQQTQSDYLISKAKYNAFEERLRMAGINKVNVINGNISGTLIITSPISGFVTKVNVNIGKMLNEQDVLFEIVDTEHLHAELTVFEKDITKIKEGQKVRFTLANNPNHELTASVHLIGRAFDESRSVRIHCHLDKEDKELLPGMFINAIIELDKKQANCISVDAVVRENEKQYIFIKEEGKSCGKHESCNDHKTYCPLEEDCPEHPDCEAHEKCVDKEKCKHKECIEHEKCIEENTLAGYKFRTIEIKTGATDGKFIEIKPLVDIEEGAEIVTKGAFFIFSQIKMSGTLDACCQ